MRSLVLWASVLTALACPASAQVVQTYTYDANGRLTGISTTGSGGTNTVAYVYDDADNRTSRSQTGTSAYAALLSLPIGRPLQPSEALVSPDGGYSLALRASGRVELEAGDSRRVATPASLAGFFAIDSAGAARFRPEADLAEVRGASLTLTDAGELMLLSGLPDVTVLWRSGMTVVEGF